MTRSATLGSEGPGPRGFQGLPARISWLGYGDARPGRSRVQRPVASGELKRRSSSAVINLDSGSVASPYRETESMLDGSDRHRRLAAAQRPG